MGRRRRQHQCRRPVAQPASVGLAPTGHPYRLCLGTPPKPRPMRWRGSWLAILGVSATLAIASPGWMHQQISLKLERLNAEIVAHPDDAEPYVQRGELYRLNREWSRAEADFESAVALTPDDTDLQFHLGRLWFEADDPARAFRARPIRRGAP